jgi:hypothetical protein
MPDTPGKRQRREVKAKKRQARDERRDARKARRNDPTAGPNEWLADEEYLRDGGAREGVAGQPIPAVPEQQPDSGDRR